MCNLYQLTASAEAIRALFRAFEGKDISLPAVARFRPDRPAPVVRATATGRALEAMIWGVPGPPAAGGRPVTNVRNLDSPFWRPLLGRSHRVLVPASAFCEWSAEPDPETGRKRQHWFALGDRPLFAFAGLYRPGNAAEPARFAFLTCPPNALVGAIHPRAMPVILVDEALDAWLDGAPAEAFQMPLPEARMVEIRPG